MERTFPQKVKPVPSCEVEEGVMVSQIRQTPLEANRLARTSAAMIGLAISVGAYGLPLPNQTDEAVAAEPVAGEPTASAAPSEFDVAAVPQRTELTQGSSSSVIEHAVQEGQTLWQIAQFYRVDAATVALDNGISTSAVLHVGQILKIPTNRQVVAVAQAADSPTNRPEYYGPVEGAKAAVSNQKVVPQAQYSEALEALKQKQERLRLSLATLKASKQSDVAPLAAQVASEAVADVTAPETGAAYRVLRGDTLEAIAKAHNLSALQLAAANKLNDPNILNVNQVLVIPQVGVETSLAVPVAAPVMIASADPNRVTLPAAVKPHRITVLSSRLNQEPAEPLLPTVSLTKSFVAPIAIGGSTEVATAPFATGQPVQADQSGSSTNYSYVENLRLEIVKLREKYQGATSQVQSTTTPTATVAASPLNVAASANADAPSTVATTVKTLEPTRYTKALQAQIRHLQASRQQSKQAEMQAAAADLAPVAPQTKPQLVATASIGSQSYEPLIPSSVGKMVSPNLPPLGSVDSYLPGNTGKFNGYIWPAKGLLTSGFGWRWGRMHKGIDIAAPVGTPVFAAAAGVVITAGWNSGGYGNMVEIQHPDGSVTLYAHNSRLVVREGQEVTQGQQIADMGSTGYSTGPHSHFEVHLPGQGAVNPMAHLPTGQA